MSFYLSFPIKLLKLLIIELAEDMYQKNENPGNHKLLTCTLLFTIFVKTIFQI
jgi:hypothetical protein